MTTGTLTKGDRVRLIELGAPDKWTQLQPGEEGTVAFIDDTGTVHVDWDSGSNLGLIAEAGDTWEEGSPVTPETHFISLEVASRWQAAYDAWTDGFAASPSADDLVYDALAVLDLETPPDVPSTELADWLDERLNAGVELTEVAAELVARLKGT